MSISSATISWQAPAELQCAIRLGDIAAGIANTDPCRLDACYVEASSSENIILEEGRLQLGTWQGIYFCEFDGPRQRSIWVKFISG